MTVTVVRLGGRPDQPLLVLGPALGTSATVLWSSAAEDLARDFQVVAWDLPGHGHNRAAPAPELTVADLARDVLEAVDALATGPAYAPTRFHYAGVSVGGAVGLQLLLDAPDRIATATLLCTGARLGTPDLWEERRATVRSSGTAALVASAAERWFAPGFLAREEARGRAVLDALSGTDDTGYAAVCGALASFDVRDRLPEVTVPVLAVAGEHDSATPPEGLAEVARAVADGGYALVPDVAHLAPVEAPGEVARLVREHVLGPPPPSRDGLTVSQVREEGLAVRREVMGDAHVDRVTAATTDLTRDFQRLVTEYAWGGIWTRPGLDRRQRSLVALTALVARGHHDELAMHLRAARRNGLTVEEITEVLLQTAVYCGVPAANAAFRIAQRTFEEDQA